MHALNFQGVTLAPVVRKNQTWITINDVTRCLYKRVDQIDPPLPNQIRVIQNLYQRHADEFTANMTRIVRIQTRGGAQDVRAFSLRGAHLLAMFSRTPAAKEFRRWVLDILDRETGIAPATATAPARRYHYPLPVNPARLSAYDLSDTRHRAADLALLDALTRDGHDITAARARLDALYTVADDYLRLVCLLRGLAGTIQQTANATRDLYSTEAHRLRD